MPIQKQPAQRFATVYVSDTIRDPDVKPPTGWCLAQLQSGDTLETLAREYFPGDPNRGAQAIAQANGVAWRIADIQAWVLRTGGRELPMAAGQRDRLPGTSTGGWAVFTDNSQIQLPCNDDKPKSGFKFPWWLLLIPPGLYLVGRDGKRKRKKGKR